MSDLLWTEATSFPITRSIMREMLLLLLSLPAWAQPVTPAPCENRLIEASARFRRAGEMITENHGPAQILAFNRGTETLELTAGEFLNNNDLLENFPEIRRYLEGRMEMSPTEKTLRSYGTRFVAVTVTIPELRLFYPLGRLPLNAAGQPARNRKRIY